MRTRDFFFELPEELIAQVPADRRDEARLLRLGRANGAISHHTIRDLPDLLPENALMVVNDSRVRKARLFAAPRSEREREFLLLRPEDEERRTWRAMTRKPGRLKTGSTIDFPGAVTAEVTGHRGQIVLLRFGKALDERYFDIHGHVPLPPYIRRQDRELDAERYQTVYAANSGSVAAPTAGLHLTSELMDRIAAHGAQIVRVTLHVGLGTFLPVRSENVEDHEMHTEEYEVSEATAEAVNRALSDGTPVIAVGTTSVRTLEAAWDQSTSAVKSGRGATDLFIIPGYRFKVIAGMLTNFHTPESTLLMLVSAFAGQEHVLRAYREAVELRYRFFSYGDAMLIQ